MRRRKLTYLSGIGALGLLFVLGCGGGDDTVDVPGTEGAVKTTAAVRADRRAFDGAPPVIPHEDLGAACVECHTELGMAVPGTGFAPPSPHVGTPGMSLTSRCRQCHVFQNTESEFVANSFAGMRQDLRTGDRYGEGAPPVIPHKTFMRDNCQACHAGPAAREEIRTTHPERTRCLQCHVPQETREVFIR